MSTYSGYTITVPPSTSPVTLAEARAQLRNEDITFDDAYVTALVAAAVSAIESRYMLAISAQTIKEFHSGFPNNSGNSDKMRLRIYPVTAVTGITYKDSNGAAQTLTISNVNVGVESYRTVITPKTGVTLPDTELGNPNAVEITYTAGFATVPTAIKQAILLMVGDWYANRENATRAMPTAAERLLEPFYPYA